MKIYFWSGLAGLIVFLLCLLAARLVPRLSGPALSDTANLASLLVNVVAVTLGLVSLLVALAAYRDAQQSGAEQKVVLESQKTILGQSNAALTSLVGQLNDQRQLLDSTLKTSTSHLQLVQEAYEREQRQLARKPKLRITVGTLTDAESSKPILLDVDGDGWAPVTFRVFNDGDADLANPIVVVTATPASIRVERLGLRLQRQRNNVLQLASEVPFRRSALMQEGAATRTETEVQIPNNGAAEFELLVRIFGDDISDVTRGFSFVARRPK